MVAQEYASKKGAKVNHPDLILQSNNHVHRVALNGGQMAQEVEFNLAVCVPNEDDKEPNRQSAIYVGCMGRDKYNNPNEPDVATSRIRFTIPIGLPVQKR